MGGLDEATVYIRQIALAAVSAIQPADFLYGTVTNLSPLAVTVTYDAGNTDTISADFLVLSRLVRGFSYSETDTISGSTGNTSGGSGTGAFDSHSHTINITRTRTVTIPFGLAVNDKVILLKKAGGQQYLILDKL
ncbi:MAG: DUF2577 domain-containing protein [Clostridiales bacterium]|nr:DUF2577 domain-containing protein [Clostridiales bacterium]